MKMDLIPKYLRIYKYHKGTGRIAALKRVFDTFLEIDLFDLARPGVTTSKIKTEPLAKIEYMPYWPAYSSVVKEMLRMAHDSYVSAIKYSDVGRKTVFIDLGCGAGKTVFQAVESNRFDLSLGVEIDSELVELAQKNLKKVVKSLSATNTILEGNAEDFSWIEKIEEIIKSRWLGVENSSITIFLFNKNSYGPNVLANSLKIIESKFKSVVYLYQNPTHANVLIEQGYIQYCEDSESNNQHKNHKYKIFLKHF
jgi:hypothetical protein